MKRAIFFLIFILCTPLLWLKMTHGFRLDKLYIAKPAATFIKQGNVPDIFAQSFSYLAHGKQSFVFESEDGRFIIKLFRKYLAHHPWRMRAKRTIAPEDKIAKSLRACQLAYEEAKDLTGLVYVHPHCTEAILPTVVLKDRLRREYLIDLNQYCFAIQYKALSIRAAFNAAVKKGDREEFFRLAKEFGSLLQERTTRHLRNADKKVKANFGYLFGRAIEWDFGNYCKDPKLGVPEYRAREIAVFTKRLQKYLRRIAPDWADEAKPIWEGL